MCTYLFKSTAEAQGRAFPLLFHSIINLLYSETYLFTYVLFTKSVVVIGDFLFTYYFMQ